MKGMFPEFDRHSEDQYKSAWENGLIVFDANVLLNLYRYRATTRDEFISTLKTLKARVWIPYQAALEFQRNRLTVIGEQYSRLGSLTSGVKKSIAAVSAEVGKHFAGRSNPLVDSTEFLSEIEKAATKFYREVEKARKKLPSLTESDKVKILLESLFEGNVGAAPATQAELDSIYKLAEERFKAKQPPGYLDADKAKDGDGVFIHKGVRYQKKYGDYVLWKQLLVQAKAVAAKEVIFVTDDRKEDWWWSIDSEGNKTIGPRHELVEEALMEAGLKVFLMYQPDRFLEYAKKNLKVTVSDDAVKEVRNISAYLDSINSRSAWPSVSMRHSSMYMESPLVEWIMEESGAVTISPEAENIHIAHDGSSRSIYYTYPVDSKFRGSYAKSENSNFFVLRAISNLIKNASARIEQGDFDQAVIVVFTIFESNLVDVLNTIEKHALKSLSRNVSVVVGLLAQGESSKFRFIESARYHGGV